MHNAFYTTGFLYNESVSDTEASKIYKMYDETSNKLVAGMH